MRHPIAHVTSNEPPLLECAAHLFAWEEGVRSMDGRSVNVEVVHPERDHRTGILQTRDRVASIVLLAVIMGVVVTTLLLLYPLTWTGLHQSPTAVAILNVRVIGGVLPVVVNGLGILALAFLLARRPSRRWVIAGGSGILGGAAIAGIVLWAVSSTNALGVQLSSTSSVWVVVAFVGIGLAIGSWWGATWLRRLGSAMSVLLTLAVATVGINADFGLDPTVGDLAGIPSQTALTLPIVKPSPPPPSTILHGGALWANWHAPSTMPATGRIAQVVIPNTASGFKARPAGLYLPPAALVANPPALPLVIMMMGQPGNPDPSFTAAVLNAFATRHDGLAPIVVVADQIGDPAIDPLCLDTVTYGKAETYIAKDVVGWARSHLHVLPDAAHWTVAGYSNGGECALSLAAKYPSIWAYPGSDRPAKTLANVFRGNTAAYSATWPVHILANATYPDTFGIFTVGSNDNQYRKEALAVSAAARAAKWTTAYWEVRNGGHVLGALNGGLTEGYALLYPRLGLATPTSAHTPPAAVNPRHHSGRFF
jgi:poly(3-hydroxybutyrate) depolymerase